MDLKVGSKKMKVWEEGIVEVVGRVLLMVVEERTIVENRIAYKVDMMMEELDMKVVASMFDAMVVY